MLAEPIQNAQTGEDATNVERLLSDYIGEAHERERQARRLLLAGAAIAGASWLVRMIALVGRTRDWWGKMPEAIEVMLISTQLVLVVAMAGGMVIMRRPNCYADQLTKLDDKRAIGPLLCENQGSVSRRSLPFVEALMRLLPQLRASDSQLLTPQEKGILYSSILPDTTLRFGINSAEQKKYQLIALSAIEQIGDEKALPMLEKLDHSGLLSPLVEEAIMRCMAAVHERGERNKLSQTLLRASVSTADNATLLKPASPNDSDNANLLRPVI